MVKPNRALTTAPVLWGEAEVGAVLKATFRRVAPFLFLQYIDRMLWRSSRGGPLNAPAAFIHPCQPIVAKR
jgi:hypothetical protein